MTLRRLLLLPLLFCAIPTWAELTVPPGFTLTEVAGPELADNIYAMTLDREGRPIVSGPGYIRRLHDDDGDGTYDRATELPHAPRSGAMGLLVDDDGTLLFWGDKSIQRIDPKKPDTPPTRLWNAGAGEHGMHAFIRGPDQWIYAVGGNRAGLKGLPYTDGNLVDAPHAGSIFRFSPDGKRVESVAQGFRNSYDIAFDPKGRLYTFDSDSERWHHLPHYKASRPLSRHRAQHRRTRSRFAHRLGLLRPPSVSRTLPWLAVRAVLVVRSGVPLPLERRGWRRCRSCDDLRARRLPQRDRRFELSRR